MSKRNKDDKVSTESTRGSKKTPRREFLTQSGLTAGAVLTTLATVDTSSGQQMTGTSMKPQVFRKMFGDALTDAKFQRDIRTNGFKALDERGFQHGVPTDVQAELEKVLFIRKGTARAANCGVCGVCGVCGLCGEVNFGSASAGLWALFSLSLTASTSTRP